MEAAQQPPAGARDLSGVERQVLILGDRQIHGAQLRQPARAAVLPPAPPDPRQPPRLVPRADLAQLDPRPVQSREVADQGAEVHPLLGREVDGELVAVPLPLGVRHFHREGVLAHPLPHRAADVVLLFAQLVGDGHVARGGTAHDAAGRSGLRGFLEGAAVTAAPALLQGGLAQGGDAAQILAPLDLDDHRIVGGQWLRGRPREVLEPVPLEPHFDDGGQLTSR